MRLISTYRLLGIGIVFYLLSSTIIAQNNKVSINPYTQTIQIGEQIRVDINVKSNGTDSIIWPVIGDTIVTQIEVVEIMDPDTIFADSNTNEEITGFKKQIVITSFDSGLWAFPELTVWIDSIPYTTEAFLIEVSTVEVDTAKAFKQIVAPMELPMTFMEYLKKYYIYGVYAWVAIIILAIIAYLIGKEAKVKSTKINAPKIPAHVIALERLEQLESENLWQSGAYKAFHIQVSDIIREYIENRFHIPVKESTTDEIKHLLKQIRLDKDLRNEVVSALRISDLAKFAKAVPLSEENEQCLATAYKLVDTTKITEVKKLETDE